MAADEGGDKTEQPTPRRREEAREEGQIARSMDLTAAVSLLAGAVLIKVCGPAMLTKMLATLQALGRPPGLQAGELLAWMKQIGRAAAEMLLPFLFFVVVVTIAATAVQSGLVVTWKRLGVKPDRLDPVAGAKRLFSGDTVSKLAIGLFKVGLVGAVAWHTIIGSVGQVLATGTVGAGGIFALAAALIGDLALRLALVMLVLGLADYALQRWKLERQLRMSKQEVRDELKRMEGDPLLKQRRRQIQRRLALQRIQQEVPKADVVVTNPTEYAVALRYDEKTMGAPRVVAKGKDLLAQRIRLVAQQHGVPIVERPPLARALYAGVEVGHEVPPAFYRAVAELLAYVYQLSRKAG